MRILLVNPPVPEIDIRAPEVATTAGLMPPMGLLSLASYLNECDRDDISLLDLQFSADPDGDLRAAVSSFAPDVAGVTCCLFTFTGAYRVVRVLKAAAPEIFTVVGGHHVSVYPEETAALPGVDAAVFGEGELTMEELLCGVERGDGAAGLAGVAARGPGGEVIKGPARERIRNLDDLPHIDRALAGRDIYNWVLDRGRRSAILFAGRGCPFRCSFCFNVMRVSRFHSPEYVVEEMRRCVSEGYEVLNFYDETFNQGRIRTMELVDAITSAGLDVPWTFRGRCDVMDEEIAHALAAAGCVRINFGIEAGTEETLKTYRKQIDLEMIRRAVHAADRAGIEAVGYFILGAPHETEEQCRATIDLACELPLDSAQFMILIPLPGTEIYRRALDEGGFENDYLRQWAADPRTPLQLQLWNTGIAEKKLVGLMRTAYSRFYLRPGFLLRQLMKLTSWKDFKVRFSAGMQIMKYSFLKKKRASGSGSMTLPQNPVLPECNSQR